MRKSQECILERADAYEIKPSQRLLLESEKYSADYYGKMFSYFVRANKENVEAVDTCEVVNLVYERFLHLPRNRRNRLRENFLFHAVKSVDVVVDMISDSRIREIGITLEEAEKLSFDYGKCQIRYFSEFFGKFMKGLSALGITEDEYEANTRYNYQENVVLDLCERNNIPIPK